MNAYNMQRIIDPNSFNYHVLQFSYDIYNVIASQKDSFVFSPLSIYEAMYLLLIGSTGQTTKELSQLLKTIPSSDDVRIMIKLKKSFIGNNTIINKIYIKNGAPVKLNYVNAVSSICDTKKAIFDNTFKPSVNNEIKKITHNLISNIIDDVNKDTVMLLLDIVYYKGLWKKIFNEGDSAQDTFYSSPPRAITFMNQKSSFMYCEDAEYQLIELPYTDNTFKMGFFLSKDTAATMDNFDIQKITYLMSHLSMREVNISIPKFTQRYHSSLSDILKQIGVTTIFDETNANFGNLFAQLKHENYFVSDIIHDAVVIVDEKGTEASAVTSIMMLQNSISIDKIITFNANHPFIYYISHIPSNTIVFLGKYA